MNQDFKIIESEGTKVGVGKSPFNGETLLVIEDNQTTAWISLSKEQVEKLKDYFNESHSLAHNVLRLAEVPHSRNFGFEQGLSCGILANRCYLLVRFI